MRRTNPSCAYGSHSSVPDTPLLAVTMASLLEGELLLASDGSFIDGATGSFQLVKMTI
jgi:hypothetical protein